MESLHQVYLGTADDLSAVTPGSIAAVITSPPYPMIAMWDEVYARSDPRISEALAGGDGTTAFELMHRVLDATWREAYRVLIPGGVLCVNIGDAARSLGGSFQLYTNHTRILQGCLSLGFVSLPGLIWRKSTNAPNKFMGSGMLPAGAYVTLEHEHILIMRKGDRRHFDDPELKQMRRRSAYFWEERNHWFSDQWAVAGSRQRLSSASRERSGAFPLAIPYRLVLMHSVYGDRVLDPFCGTGTTLLAALAAGRDSIGYEIDDGMAGSIRDGFAFAAETANRLVKARIRGHVEFIEEQEHLGRPVGHENLPHGFAVKTAQERDMELMEVAAVREESPMCFRARYRPAEVTLYRQADLF
jgi:DNA modification methylase